MGKTIVFMILLFAITGCAQHYVNYDGSRNFTHDDAFCRNYANRVSPNMQYQSSTTSTGYVYGNNGAYLGNYTATSIPNNSSAGFYNFGNVFTQNSLYEQCLQQLGWMPTD